MDSLKRETTDELLACRICLDTDTQLYNIIEYNLDSAYVEIVGTMPAAWDGLPQHVCGACRRLLRRAAGLRARGLRAQRLLKDALLQRPCITTEYIRSLDRVSSNLVLALSVARGAEPLVCCHDDLVKEEPPAEPDYKDFADDGSDRVSPKLEDAADAADAADDGDADDADDAADVDDADDDVALSELRPRGATKKVPRKHKIKKVKTEKAEQRRKTMKIRDEDFPAFEEEYNTDVIILTREQQAEDMAARKLRDNYVNSQFKCERCFKGFYTADTLRNHHLKHHAESVGAHSCALCGCRFRIPAILRRHLATHRLRFVCRHCGFTARDRSHAMTHSKEHKGLRYECQHCGDTFTKRSTYGTHVRVQHPGENSSCDVCGETFLGALGLALHKKKTHRQTEAEAEAEAGAARCAACGAVFACRYALARHAAAAAHACAALRACSLCGANFADDAALQQHTRERHSTRQTQCQECGSSFATEASLGVHHERVHLRLKVRRRLPRAGRKYERYGDQFMCEMCGKKCQNNIALKYHIRSHTGEKPHGCPHCPKHYSTPVALQYHIRSHTGDKPLVCPHCPLRYATHKGLQTHLLKHTGERPFKCDLCGKAFTQKTMLQKHKTVHTGEKPFSCEICGKAFTQSGSVHTHVKYVHRKLPAPPRNRGRRDRPDNPPPPPPPHGLAG